MFPSLRDKNYQKVYFGVDQGQERLFFASKELLIDLCHNFNLYLCHAFSKTVLWMMVENTVKRCSKGLNHMVIMKILLSPS